MVLDDAQAQALYLIIWMQVWPWLLAFLLTTLVAGGILIDWIRLRFFK